MGWKQNRAEKKLMMLDKQREKLMGKMDTGRRVYDRRDDRMPRERPRYRDERGEYPREPRGESIRSFDQPHPDQDVQMMKERAGKIAEEALRSMPKELTPTEVLFVITIMIKMVCLLIEDN